jgi:RNA polymerase sigma-70 factor, ECF subfamily
LSLLNKNFFYRLINMTENNSYNENYIINEIINGNYELFSSLISAYQNSLFLFVKRLVRNEEDASDITQEIFFKAYRSLKSFKFKSKFSTWLYKIAYNESISFNKKNKKIDEIVFPESGNEFFKIEKDNTDHELTEYIEKLLHDLKNEQRIALHLLYKEDKSYLEIADVMAIPVNTVKSHIRRGKDILKQKLLEKYDINTVLA